MKSKIAAKYIERIPYLQQFKNGVIHAVEITEQEAERRHEEEIEELTKAHVDKNVPLLHFRRWWDKCRITIVDSEEARHEKEIKSLLKAHIEDIHALSRKFDEILDERIKGERKKATDAFCNGCECLIPASCPCAAFDHFINRLSANDHAR